MKHLFFSVFVFTILINTVFAQNKLTNSRTDGYYTYVYKLTDKETFKIATDSKLEIDETFLHTQVDSFYNDKPLLEPKLPYGNYLYVKAVADRLNYRFVCVANVALHFINNGRDFQFSVTDLKGNPVTDAEVTAGKGKRVRYDTRAGLFLSTKDSDKKVIKVSYKGVSNYFKYENEDRYKPRKPPFFKQLVYSAPLKYTWMPVKRLFNNEGKDKARYKGYVVFNKPRYKPLDTVKFKSYLITAKGKDIHDKPLKVTLRDAGGKEEERVLTAALMPYRAGGYEYSFVLADSLNMTLDKYYYIDLSEKYKDSWRVIKYGFFNYEDYELKSTKFSARTDKETHSPGNPVTVFLKATDENELAVPDGRVEVIATLQNVQKYHGEKVFVKDTLWKKNIVLDPVGETKLVIPDSIFPKADLKFMLRMNFLNSNNESRSTSKDLIYLIKTAAFIGKLKRDSIHLDYLEKGVSVLKKVRLITETSSGNIDSSEVQLPLMLKIDNRISSYSIKNGEAFLGSVDMEDLKPELSIAAAQKKDSLTISVRNEGQIPFWYTVFSGNQVTLRGYSTRLDTIIKQGGANASHVSISYIWDDEEVKLESNTFYNPGMLNVSLLAPNNVYPGQTVNMEVKVTDQDDKPVVATDITAYGYTSKFANTRTVELPNFGKEYYDRKKKPVLELDKLSSNASMKLNWEKWGRSLGLDTIEYYRFTQTKDLYTITENSKDTMAVVAPFVVNKGKIEPVNVVYVDDVPVYFSQAEQLQNYAFRLSPGKHAIKLRTSTSLAILTEYNFPKGKKTILSIAADLQNTKAIVSRRSVELDADESALLTKYMIRVEDNFKETKTTIGKNEKAVLLNPDPLKNVGKNLLIGPFSENILDFKSGDIKQNFLKEPGYNYTFSSGFLKQKSYESKYGFSLLLSGVSQQNNDNYKQFPLKESDLDAFWDDYLNLRNRTTLLFNYPYFTRTDQGKLEMRLDSSISNHLPFLKNVLMYKNDEPDFLRIYPGSITQFDGLDKGNYKMIYLFKDNRYFVTNEVNIKSGGRNYYQWKGMKILPADSLSIKIDRDIKAIKYNNRWLDGDKDVLPISEKLNDAFFDSARLVNTMTGRVVDGEDGSGLSGVAVKVKGLAIGVTTGGDGRFTIKVPERGLLQIRYVGYSTLEIPVYNGAVGDIKIKTDNQALNEVVVVGYGTQKKATMTGSITRNDLLSGKVPGVQASYDKLILRGNSVNTGSKPLIIVNGLPFNGELSAIDPNTIVNINMLTADQAKEIYGSSGLNGAVVIETKEGNSILNVGTEVVPQENSIRTNFSDYAIWKPKLVTDEEGKASFSVKFPDDITNWETRVVALNGHRQAGFLETNIKSFKTLSANFVSPQFAVIGDRMNVIGKLMNYGPKEETVTRIFKYNDSTKLNNVVIFKNAQIDTMNIIVAGKAGDSLKFEYTMKKDNGYFDGEIRKVPLLSVGVMETKGYFSALTRDTAISYSFDPNHGKVTLRAEASVFPTLLDEIDKLRRYEYLCNEQLASKLKALLLEKTVRKYLGETFKEEKNIKELLKKLQQNQRVEGTWGWWKNSDEESWISLHVVEALLLAEKEGYVISLKKDRLYSYLVGQLGSQRNIDQVHAVKLLYLLNKKYQIKDWIEEIEKDRLEAVKKTGSKVQPLYEKLQLMELKQKADLKIDLKWLLDLKKETMMGNVYWGEQSTRFWDNSIQNTLLAYQILKVAGGHQTELEGIQRYFLEQRKDGQWRNTYESSLILETILPALLMKGKPLEPASLTLNKSEKVTVFPYEKVVEPQMLNIEKKGNAPVYFTAYQQFNNADPKKVSKDFTVKTWFDQGGNNVQKLKAGTLTTLKVEVDVSADADYVMIEIPIPAGCSYENKLQNFWGIERHREYFKHKTSIFCTKLKKGKYTFNIDLMPRYSGEYVLNPAKAEMMYFPTFFGREGMKQVEIK